ncbi:hypothetical protein BD626DRAFT_536157 [Schizophyllum amplum]|uniref:ARID domain-containing protein n=1 Tax=Schizophyllum amplum TaxID=97359 RepID=A0A550CJN2_9AGAR|nr:hypothetical protein BD626DRAFT_536157 [Auriculariopsis ampla]
MFNNNGAFTPQNMLSNQHQNGQDTNNGMAQLNTAGFTPDQQRMWQQMQMQQQSSGNQFRPQSGAAQDFMPGSMNEMSNLMGNPGFQTRMTPQQQQQLARGFNNGQASPQQMLSMMGMGGSAPANNRNANPMLQAFPQSVPGASRQLDLMAAAQNQQNQNAPLQMQQMLRLQQQQRASISAQSPNVNALRSSMPNNQVGMFTSPPMNPMDPRRTSPVHPQQGSMSGPAGPNPGPSNPHVTLLQYTERLTELRNTIVNLETELRQKTMQRASGGGDGMSEETLQVLSGTLRSRKEHFSRLQALVMRMRSGRMLTEGDGNLAGGPSDGPFATQHGVGSSGPTQGAGPSSSPWMQAGGLGPFGNGAQQSGAQTSPANAAASLPQGSNAPPRSGPTPQLPSAMLSTPQQMNGRLPSGSFSMSPNMSAFQPQSQPQGGASFASGGQPGLSNSFPPPLEKTRFEHIYANFCNKHPDLKRDPRITSVDGRPIDLHKLHVEVNREGGMNKVKANNAWPIIAARLGFASTHATDTEPAKARPDIADHVASCYQECLGLFDTQLYQIMSESRRRDMMSAAASMQGQGIQSAAANSNITLAPGQQIPPLSRLTPQQIQMLLKYAQVPAETLRAQGIDHRLINMVELHRSALQRQQMEQQAFRGGMRPGGAAQNGMQQGPAPPGGMSPDNFAAGAMGRPQNAAQRPPQPGMPAGGVNAIPSPGEIPVDMFVKVMHAIPYSEQQLQQSKMLIDKARNEFQRNGISRMGRKDVPPELQSKLAHLVQQTNRIAALMDEQLPRFFLLIRREDITKGLLSAFTILNRQFQLLGSQSPHFIISVEDLSVTLVKMKECAEVAITQGRMILQRYQQQQRAAGMAANGAPAGPLPPLGLQQNSAQPPLPQQMPPAPLPPRPPVNLQPPPLGKHKKTASTPATSPAAGGATATPPPTTPAITPAQMAASPSNVKSPKTKPAPKPKAAPKRRASRASALTPPSTSQAASTPATEPQTPTTGKRRREDDPAQSPANGPSPPKRAKQEDTGAASFVKPEDEAAKLESKTDAEVAAYLDQMKQLVQQASESDGSSASLNANISEMFDEIMKQGLSVPGASGDGGMDMSAPLDLPDTTAALSSSADDLGSFFDWTAYGTNADVPDDSVAPTPDLLHSSTNTSPESAAGGDQDSASHSGAVEGGAKSEEESDQLLLGIWKDIEGGSESLYHQAAQEWRWDGAMPTSEQPWAISMS